MLALFSILGLFLGICALLGRFFVACWRFLRLLGRSGVDFEGLGGSKTSVWETKMSFFFVAFSLLYAYMAEML